MADFLYTFGVLGFYMLPALTAFFRGHKNTSAISVLNLFLGWTVVCWIISLVWASTNNIKRVA